MFPFSSWEKVSSFVLITNKHLRELGYKDKLTAHGWRSVALTAGQDVFNFSHDLIQRQMGHEIGDKVRNI